MALSKDDLEKIGNLIKAGNDFLDTKQGGQCQGDGSLFMKDISKIECGRVAFCSSFYQTLGIV